GDWGRGHPPHLPGPNPLSPRRILGGAPTSAPAPAAWVTLQDIPADGEGAGSIAHAAAGLWSSGVSLAGVTSGVRGPARGCRPARPGRRVGALRDPSFGSPSGRESPKAEAGCGKAGITRLPTGSFGPTNHAERPPSPKRSTQCSPGEAPDAPPPPQPPAPPADTPACPESDPTGE